MPLGRKRRSRDVATVALWLAAWVAVFAMGARSVLDLAAFPSVYVTAPATAEGYPTLSGFRAHLEGRKSGLEVGDRLVRLDDLDLRGVGPAELFALVMTEVRGRAPRARIVFHRGEERGETSLSLGAARKFWWALPTSVAFAAVAALLRLRAPPSPLVRALFRAFMAAALFFASTAHASGSRAAVYAAMVVATLSTAALVPLALRAAQLFPRAVPPKGLWARAGPWAFAALGPASMSALYGLLFSPEIGYPAGAATAAAACAGLLRIGTRNYRRADVIGRRRFRWVVLGAYVGLAPPILVFALTAVDLRYVPLALASLSFTALTPVCVFIAVTRYDLFDIDRLLSATATYSVLIVALAVLVEVFVEPLGGAAARAVGIDPGSGQVALGVLLAAAVIPAQRRLRPHVERVLFAERHALERGIERLLEEIASGSDSGALLRLTGERLDSLLRPECYAVYRREGTLFAPVYARCETPAPSVGVDRPLAAALAGRVSPVEVEGGQLARAAGALGPVDQEILETLGTAVLVPVRPGGALSVFLSLGAKRSGDVYTGTDHALLSTVSHQLATRLADVDVGLRNQNG